MYSCKLDFPQIPGVMFRMIQADGFYGYAISSDMNVWNGRGGKWRKMEPYTRCTGKLGIKLNRSNGVGASVFDIEQLHKEAFG